MARPWTDILTVRALQKERQEAPAGLPRRTRFSFPSDVVTV